MPFQTSFSETMNSASSIEDIQIQLEELKSSLEQYQAHSRWLNKEGGTVVSKHFQKLFRKWRTSRNTVLQATPTKVKKDVLTQWENFTQASHPTDSEKISMLREGLSSNELLNQFKFIDWLKKWDYSQRICFRWLHTCVWHHVLLKPEPSYTIQASLLTLYNEALENAPLAVPKNHSTEWHRFYQAFRTQELPQILQRHCESLLQKLLDSDCSMEESHQWLADELKAELGLLQALSPQHPLVEDMVDQYFTTALKRYIHTEATEKPKRLDKLLNTFCLGLKIQETARQRFQRLWQSLGFSEGRYTTEERQCVQSFCLSQLEDPRLAPHNWLPLKQLDEPMYQKLLFWFNEADFNLFFRFVFQGAVDEHGRKECWERYLYYALDFRIFLPKNELQRFEQFLRLNESENTHTVLKPILNESNLTSFLVLLSDDVLIFETKEPYNSAYIYDLKALRSESFEENKEEVLKVLKAADVFKNTNIKSLPLKRLLAHGDALAPNGSSEYYFNKRKRNWRFTHDQNYFWHDKVRLCMKQVYDIEPKG